MSERRKPHNGRDKSVHFKVKRADVEDLTVNPEGNDVVRHDVRLCGAVEDIGPTAGKHGERIGQLVDLNRYEVGRLTGQQFDRRRRRRD